MDRDLQRRLSGTAGGHPRRQDIEASTRRRGRQGDGDPRGCRQALVASAAVPRSCGERGPAASGMRHFDQHDMSQRARYPSRLLCSHLPHKGEGRSAKCRVQKANISDEHFRKLSAPTLLLLPAIIVLAAVVVVPLLFSLYSSFTPFRLTKPEPSGSSSAFATTSNILTN